SELVVENYAGRMSQLAHQHGLKFTAEAYGSPCDHLPYAGQADEPMGEFWVGGSAFETCRGMASAAHTYGSRSLAPKRSPPMTLSAGRSTRQQSRRWETGLSVRESTALCSTATLCSRGPMCDPA